MNEYLVAVPAFNEEKNIEKVIHSLKQLNAPIDVVIINDGSSDQTALRAHQAGAKVVSHPTNLGYLAAIQTGFKYAEKHQYPFIIFFDGDGQHDPICVNDMIKAITRDGVDVVIGSRFLIESNMKTSFAKMLAIKFFRSIIYRTTKKHITDPTSGFKAFKANVYKRFTNSKDFYYDLPDSNFIIDILLQNHHVLEIPVNMFEREHGESKIHHSGIKPMIYMAQTILSIFIVIMKNKFQPTGGKTS
ncbi:glycosyltransferase family 2 protein [Bacillus sp. BRMEA1]|uniref:glycosyltransferase family 2 protein n=1 Tax=Neobacillus endophyticus TaxID=2738405 RepID=UPI0015659359|nr:glycosyltransferase family 2 protein [Neobacillus endophyticus]NRD77989.1 glycosyltransferase family 2 protein [Neobacillus endophyticus]